MITVSGKTITGKTIIFKELLSFEHNADRFVPCDSFSFTAVLQHHNEEFYEIIATLNGEQIFCGIVDSSEIIISDKGMLIKIDCRNKTALLIDNEVKPNIYSKLTSAQLFEQYAKPFGVVKSELPFLANQWAMQVNKGASNWSVIEGYCLRNYNALPYINHKQTLTLSPFNPVMHTISNKGTGIKFSKLSIKRDYHKLISRLYMKTGTDTYTYFYGVVLDNKNAISKRVLRERYYHPNDVRVAVNKSMSQQILDNSNRDSFTVTVTINSLENIHIGDLVSIYDNSFSSTSLYVSRAKLSANGSSGLMTTLTLCDKSHFK